MLKYTIRFFDVFQYWKIIPFLVWVSKTVTFECSWHAEETFRKFINCYADISDCLIICGISGKRLQIWLIPITTNPICFTFHTILETLLNALLIPFAVTSKASNMHLSKFFSVYSLVGWLIVNVCTDALSNCSRQRLNPITLGCLNYYANAVRLDENISVIISQSKFLNYLGI